MTQLESPILCATDLMAGGARSLDLAVLAARALGLSIVLAHVTDAGTDAESAAPRAVAEAERTMRDRVKARVEQAREHLAREAARGGEAVAETIILEGRPWEAIVRHAAEIKAAAIVVGPHAHSTSVSEMASWLVGGTADQVVRRASCPVWVATGREPLGELRQSTWVVGVDLDPCSRAALETASAYAMRAGAELHAIWARRSANAAGEDAGEAGFAALLDGSSKRTHGVRLRGSKRIGEPAPELAAAVRADHASLVVVGTHGRRGVARAILGSVAEATLRTATVPVLVIPTAD